MRWIKTTKQHLSSTTLCSLDQYNVDLHNSKSSVISIILSLRSYKTRRDSAERIELYFSDSALLRECTNSDTSLYIKS